jgi:hypothetical protein
MSRGLDRVRAMRRWNGWGEETIDARPPDEVRGVRALRAMVEHFDPERAPDSGALLPERRH